MYSHAEPEQAQDQPDLIDFIFSWALPVNAHRSTLVATSFQAALRAE